jgi:hypothetical protein
MKFSFIILTTFVILCGSIMSKSNLKNNDKKSLIQNKYKINILGETYDAMENFGNHKTAISDAAASVPLNAEEYIDFPAPQMVDHLAEEPKHPKAGPLEAIIEVPTTHDYYDGSLNLNKIKVNCRIYTSRANCVHQSVCGWCGSSDACVLGTQFGPEQPCIKSSFIYGKPAPNYNTSMSKMVNEPVGGVYLSILSPLKQ